MKNLFLTLATILISVLTLNAQCDVDITHTGTIVDIDTSVYSSSPTQVIKFDENQPVELTASGIDNATYSWNMGDGNVVVGSNISYLYEVKSSIFPVILTTTSNDCSTVDTIYVWNEKNVVWDICDIDDVQIGDTINLDGSMISNLFWGNDTNQIFMIGEYDTITISGFADDATFAGNMNELFQINTNFEHSNVGALRLELQCPNNNELTFSVYGDNNTDFGEPVHSYSDVFTPGIGYDYSWTPNNNNDIYHNLDSFINTHTFIDEVGDTIENQRYVQSNTYNPGIWNELEGCPLNGDWIVRIVDRYSNGENGFLFHWSLDLNYKNVVNLPSTYTWTSEEVTVDDEAHNGEATLIFNDPGYHDVTLTTTNSIGVSYDTTITIWVNYPADVEEIVEEVEVKLGPNPTSNIVNLTYTLNNTEDVSINLYDMSGKLIKTIVNENQFDGVYDYTINLKDYKSGVYIVKGNVGNKNIVERVLLTK